MGPTVGSLFSGIGGLDLGLERAGWSVRWQVEVDPFCRQVLEKHWPETRRYPDVRTVDFARVEPVDLIAGGFPCQPVSNAGRRLVQDDPRWLWPEFARAVRALRPRLVLVENVPGLLYRGAGAVFGDLAACGYDAEWSVLPAAAVGAPHLRERVFIVAYPHGQHGETRLEPVTQSLSALRESGLPERLRERWLAPYSGIRGVSDGIPGGLDRRVAALGNAVVPQVAEWLGRALIAVLNEVANHGENHEFMEKRVFL